MRIIEAEVNISSDHHLSIQLPEDIAAGTYQVAIVITPQAEPKPSQHQLNQLAGKISAFRGLDPVAWQQQIRGEWDDTRLSD